jgi:uncharacterized protein YaaR (DUF327 family)
VVRAASYCGRKENDTKSKNTPNKKTRAESRSPCKEFKTLRRWKMEHAKKEKLTEMTEGFCYKKKALSKRTISKREYTIYKTSIAFFTVSSNVISHF